MVHLLAIYVVINLISLYFIYVNYSVECKIRTFFPKEQYECIRTDVEYWKITSCKDCSHLQFLPATVLSVVNQTR